MKVYVVLETDSDGASEILSIHSEEIKALRKAKKTLSQHATWDDICEDRQEPKRRDFKTETEWIDEWLSIFNGQLAQESPEGVNVYEYNVE